jgi:hypothetical protein
MRRESSRGAGLPAGLAGLHWQRTGRSGSAHAPPRPARTRRRTVAQPRPSRRPVAKEDGVRIGTLKKAVELFGLAIVAIACGAGVVAIALSPLLIFGTGRVVLLVTLGPLAALNALLLGAAAWGLMRWMWERFFEEWWLDRSSERLERERPDQPPSDASHESR